MIELFTLGTDKKHLLCQPLYCADHDISKMKLVAFADFNPKTHRVVAVPSKARAVFIGYFFNARYDDRVAILKVPNPAPSFRAHTTLPAYEWFPKAVHEVISAFNCMKGAGMKVPDQVMEFVKQNPKIIRKMRKSMSPTAVAAQTFHMVTE